MLQHLLHVVLENDVVSTTLLNLLAIFTSEYGCQIKNEGQTRHSQATWLGISIKYYHRPRTIHACSPLKSAERDLNIGQCLPCYQSVNYCTCYSRLRDTTCIHHMLSTLWVCLTQVFFRMTPVVWLLRFTEFSKYISSLLPSRPLKPIILIATNMLLVSFHLDFSWFYFYTVWRSASMWIQRHGGIEDKELE